MAEAARDAILRARGLQWLFWSALALYVAVLPIRHTIALRYLAFFALIGATLALLARRREWPQFPIPLAWAAYAAVAAVSIAYAVDPRFSLSEFRVEILYTAVVFSVAATWGRALDMTWRFGLILTAANAVLAGAALMYVDLGSSEEEVRGLPDVAYAGVNSNFLVAIVPLLGYFGWRLWRTGWRFAAGAVAALLVLDTGMLVISYNRQALAALAVAVVCAGALLLRGRFTWRRLAVLLVLVAAIAGLFAWQLERRADALGQTVQQRLANDQRWELWRFSVQRIAERPWAGGGFGRGVFDKLYPEFMAGDRNIWHAHNMVLNKGIQMGIPGMLVFLLLWLALARQFWRRLDSGPEERRALAVAGLATLAAVFAKNMTDDFFVRDMALLFWLLMGFVLGSLRRQGP